MPAQPALAIHLLGELRLTSGQQALPFAALPRTAGLLAYLLLHQGAPLPRARLAFTLWPDVPEAQARANLRRHLADLRRALPPPPADSDWLESDGQHIRWAARAETWVDAVAFAELLGAGRRAEAVELYRGDLLPHLDDHWAQVERERLRAAFVGALEALLAPPHSPEGLPQAIAYAQRLVAAEPLSEPAACRLMELHAAAGNRGAALRAYQQLAERMREELGLEPLPETRALAARLAAPGPRPAPAGPPLAHLPAPTTPLVGRVAELEAIVATLAPAGRPTRLLTLTGPGGAGKTRLAIAAAAAIVGGAPEEYPAGAAFVALAEIHDPALVLPRIAAGLGLRDGAAGPLQGALAAALREQRLLLVLDNCEHLLAAAPAIEALLAGAPGLSILATSRETLGIAGEHRLPVPPLTLPDLAALPPLADLARCEAVALFTARARAAAPGFALGPANAAAVAAICVALDGLPLAIELAAAQADLLSPAALAARLAARLDLLSNPSPAAPPRQQSLRAVIGWSYQLLAPPERAALARVAVFAGGWTLPAAAHLLADEGAAPDEGATLATLRALVRKSLVVAEPGGDEPRFALLETIRAFALEQLAGDEREGAARRHARYFLAVAEEAGAGIARGDQQRWVGRVEADLDNLRAALDWGLAAEPALALGLAAALWGFWSLRGHLREGRRALEQALAAAPAAPDRLRAAALVGLGNLAWTQADYPAAQAALEAGLALQRSLADEAGQAATLHRLGAVAGYQGDFARATALYRESLAISRRLDDGPGIANTLNNLAIIAQEEGRLAEAEALYREALERYRRAGARRGITIALHNLGDLAMVRGESAAAEALYRESLALRRELGDREGAPFGLRGLAEVARAAGRPLDAARIWGAEEALRERIGVAVPHSDRPTYEAQVAAARAAADPAAFAAAFAAGRALGLDQILAELLGPAA